MTLPKAALLFLHRYSLISASRLCKLATVLFCLWNIGKLMEAEWNLFPRIKKGGQRNNFVPRFCSISTLRILVSTRPGEKITSVQLLSHVRLFATTGTAACQASLSITNAQSLLKLMSIESVMPPYHLIFCRPLLLPPWSACHSSKLCKPIHTVNMGWWQELLSGSPTDWALRCLQTSLWCPGFYQGVWVQHTLTI